MLVGIAAPLFLSLAVAASIDSGPGAPWSSAFAPVGTSGEVRAVVRFDDGSGDALYVAGEFGGTADAVSSGVARWDGSQWSDVGGGLDLADGEEVLELGVLPTAGGTLLAAVGSFETLGGEPCGGVAIWDGTQWARLGDGPPVMANEVATLVAVALFDDGVGEQIWVGGSVRDADFYIPGTRPYLAYWDGQAWTRVIDGPGPAFCFDYYYCDYDSIASLGIGPGVAFTNVKKRLTPRRRDDVSPVTSRDWRTKPSSVTNAVAADPIA